MADENSTSGFTSGETKIITCIMKHLRCDIQADFDAVARELGYKDASIAKTRWSQIKRKKIAGAAGATPSKASPGKRKKAAATSDDEEVATPAKKKGGKKGKKGKVESDGDEEVKAEGDAVKEEAVDEEGF